MLKIQHIYRCILYVVFHNLDPKMQGILMLKGFTLKRSKGIFVRENLKKISIVIKNVIWSEKTLIHKAELPSNYFSQFFHI